MAAEGCDNCDFLLADDFLFVFSSTSVSSPAQMVYLLNDGL